MLFRSLSLIAVVLVGMLVLVALRVQATQEAYRLHRMDARIETEQKEKVRLHSRHDALVTPAMAKRKNKKLKLGLQPPEQFTVSPLSQQSEGTP